MPANNRAAFQPSKLAPALTVSDTLYPTPSKGQLVIRNAAVAINPIDWMIQSRGDLVFPWLKYSAILGFDAAGEVVQVGEGVTRFQPGDRVFGLCRGTEKEENQSSQGAFQHYTLLHQDWTSPMTPASMTFEQGATLPLAVATASAALFDDSHLGLQLPTVPARAPTGKTVLVWGGSSSVGASAIQLAIAAGYEVFTTASPHNHDFVRSLGATKVWDYRSPTIVDDIAAALQDRIVAGVVSMGQGAADKCMCVLEKAPESANKFIAMATLPMPEKEMGMLRTAAAFANKTMTYKVRRAINGVNWKYVSMAPLATNGINKAIFEDFLPKALESGSYIPALEAVVAGHGLESIQQGFEVQKKGVSAKKIVVTL